MEKTWSQVDHRTTGLKILREDLILIPSNEAVWYRVKIWGLYAIGIYPPKKKHN